MERTILLKAIRKDDLASFVESLITSYEVVGPSPKEFKFAYKRISSPSELALSYNTTLLPPKKYLLPQKETLLQYTMGETPRMEPVFDRTPRVLFGVHSCDLHGIWLIDDVMAEGAADPHYFARREKAVIIGIDCKEPCYENSFCKSMGTLKPSGGYDLFLTDMGELYVVQVGTRAGERLLSRGEFFPVSYTLKDRFYQTWLDKAESFPARVEYDTEKLPLLLADAYDSMIWDALEERCFDCGACTVVCPTCYCFDVQDEAEVDLKRGARFRKWDSCQLQDFAVVAGGSNFRGKRSDRLRHRFMRKGRYFKEKFGRFACVGCGRCGRSCLVNIDVLTVFNQLKG
jgi:sulfhydrogenase subunit beta (sulfur reductase)